MILSSIRPVHAPTLMIGNYYDASAPLFSQNVLVFKIVNSIRPLPINVKKKALEDE